MEENKTQEELFLKELLESNIEYSTYAQSLTIAKKGLIGNYDENDKYSINIDLCKELTLLEKLISESTSTSMFATAVCGEIKLKFIVTFAEGENKRLATLKLEEKNGEEELITNIASYVDFDDPNFLFRMKKAFHLNNEAEYKDKGEKNIIEKFPNLIKTVRTRKRMVDIDNFDRENTDKNYVDSVLRILKQNTGIGMVIFVAYMDKVNPKNGKFTPQKQREILDKMLFDVIKSGKMPTDLFEEIHKQRQILSAKLKQATTEYEIKNAPAPVKQPEVKKPAKAKSSSDGGKSKSGGKAKAKGGSKAKEAKKVAPYESKKLLLEEEVKDIPEKKKDISSLISAITKSTIEFYDEKYLGKNYYDFNNSKKEADVTLDKSIEPPVAIIKKQTTIEIEISKS